MAKLAPAQLNFWRQVASAAFANPFSPERREFDRQIVGKNVSLSSDRLAQQLQQAVALQIEQLERNGLSHLRDFSGAEREMMRIGFLFENYHRFYDRLDELILRQIRSGDACCPAPFAEEAMAALTRRGFSEPEAIRYFAIFYQVRRAHYFIVQGLIGQSACMRQLQARLWKNVFTSDIQWYDQFLWDRMEDFSTLLLGETGTGKGAAAAAIGRSAFIPFDPVKGCFAESFTRSFVSLNLSQFPETLIESELFGHKKGAFTGAIEAHQGVFARCSRWGAIFLDEIGDLSTHVQLKLLQVLQERTFSPVGSRAKERFSGRVIAATNKSIDELRRQNLFRDDFYYRLCSDVIVVPSLQQRLRESPEELDLLLRHLLSRMTGPNSGDLFPQVKELLLKGVGADYSWPGNVRELEQAIRRILITREYSGQAKNVTVGAEAGLVQSLIEGTMTAEQLLSQYCQLLYQRTGNYQEVSRRAQLDPRTVKKHLERAARG